MQNKLLIVSLAAALASSAALAQTTVKPSAHPEPGYEHYITSLMAIDQRFAALDADHNSYIDSDEAQADPALARDFSRIARNGRIDRPVYTSWLKRQSTAASHPHGNPPPATVHVAP